MAVSPPTNAVFRGRCPGRCLHRPMPYSVVGVSTDQCKQHRIPWSVSFTGQCKQALCRAVYSLLLPWSASPPTNASPIPWSVSPPTYSVAGVSTDQSKKVRCGIVYSLPYFINRNMSRDINALFERIGGDGTEATPAPEEKTFLQDKFFL